MSGGFFDLPAPLFDLVDGALAVALPAALRVVIYGAVAGALGVLIYARISNQKRLRELGEKQQRELHQAVLHEGGKFDLAIQVEALLLVSKDRFLIMLPAALIASAPMLFLLPWLGHRFDADAIAPGTEVCAKPWPTFDAPRLEWRGGSVAWDEKRGCWLLQWPTAETPLALFDGTLELTRLPWREPTRAIRSAGGWDNFTMNPAGVMPEGGPLYRFELDVPERTLIPFIPPALGGWEALFFPTAIVAALWLKFRRNVA